MSTRRSALAFLGLTGAGSVALAHEHMVTPDPGKLGFIMGTDWSEKKTADALRRLADGIEDKTVEVAVLDLSTSLRPDQYLIQKLNLEFYLKEGE